jgi:hypothetical protein
MGDFGHGWHFTSDPVSPAQLAAEELFELGFVKLESWKWTDRTVVKYKPTKAGRAELRKYRRELDAKFKKIFAKIAVDFPS